jgi:hypothetical protein
MRILSLFAVAVVALAGCGSEPGAPDPGAAPSPSVRAAEAGPTPAPEPASSAQLARALLTTGDLPSGYERDPQVRSGGIAGHPVPRCRVVMGSLADAVDATVVGHADIGFGGGDARPLVAESVVSLREADAAGETARLTRTFAACRAFSFTDDQGVRYAYTVEPLSFPSLGDESTAVAITMSTTGSGYDFAMGGTQVLVRTGRTLATVVMMGFPNAVRATEFERTARAAVARLG